MVMWKKNTKKTQKNIKCFEYNLLYITLYTHVDDLIYSKEVNKTISQLGYVNLFYILCILKCYSISTSLYIL